MTGGLLGSRKMDKDNKRPLPVTPAQHSRGTSGGTTWGRSTASTSSGTRSRPRSSTTTSTSCCGRCWWSRKNYIVKNTKTARLLSSSITLQVFFLLQSFYLVQHADLVHGRRRMLRHENDRGKAKEEIGYEFREKSDLFPLGKVVAGLWSWVFGSGTSTVEEMYGFNVSTNGTGTNATPSNSTAPNDTSTNISSNDTTGPMVGATASGDYIAAVGANNLATSPTYAGATTNAGHLPKNAGIFTAGNMTSGGRTNGTMMPLAASSSTNITTPAVWGEQDAIRRATNNSTGATSNWTTTSNHTAINWTTTINCTSSTAAVSGPDPAPPQDDGYLSWVGVNLVKTSSNTSVTHDQHPEDMKILTTDTTATPLPLVVTSGEQQMREEAANTTMVVTLNKLHRDHEQSFTTPTNSTSPNTSAAATDETVGKSATKRHASLLPIMTKEVEDPEVEVPVVLRDASVLSSEVEETPASTQENSGLDEDHSVSEDIDKPRPVGDESSHYLSTQAKLFETSSVFPKNLPDVPNSTSSSASVDEFRFISPHHVVSQQDEESIYSFLELSQELNHHNVVAAEEDAAVAGRQEGVKTGLPPADASVRAGLDYVPSKKQKSKTSAASKLPLPLHDESPATAGNAEDEHPIEDPEEFDATSALSQSGAEIFAGEKHVEQGGHSGERSEYHTTGATASENGASDSVAGAAAHDQSQEDEAGQNVVGVESISSLDEHAELPPRSDGHAGEAAEGKNAESDGSAVIEEPKDHDHDDEKTGFITPASEGKEETTVPGGERVERGAAEKMQEQTKGEVVVERSSSSAVEVKPAALSVAPPPGGPGISSLVWGVGGGSAPRPAYAESRGEALPLSPTTGGAAALGVVTGAASLGLGHARVRDPDRTRTRVVRVRGGPGGADASGEGGRGGGGGGPPVGTAGGTPDSHEGSGPLADEDPNAVVLFLGYVDFVLSELAEQLLVELKIHEAEEDGRKPDSSSSLDAAESTPATDTELVKVVELKGPSDKPVTVVAATGTVAARDMAAALWYAMTIEKDWVQSIAGSIDLIVERLKNLDRKYPMIAAAFAATGAASLVLIPGASAALGAAIAAAPKVAEVARHANVAAHIGLIVSRMIAKLPHVPGFPAWTDLRSKVLAQAARRDAGFTTIQEELKLAADEPESPAASSTTTATFTLALATGGRTITEWLVDSLVLPDDWGLAFPVSLEASFQPHCFAAHARLPPIIGKTTPAIAFSIFFHTVIVEKVWDFFMDAIVKERILHPLYKWGAWALLSDDTAQVLFNPDSVVYQDEVRELDDLIERLKAKDIEPEAALEFAEKIHQKKAAKREAKSSWRTWLEEKVFDYGPTKERDPNYTALLGKVLEGLKNDPQTPKEAIGEDVREDSPSTSPRELLREDQLLGMGKQPPQNFKMVEALPLSYSPETSLPPSSPSSSAADSPSSSSGGTSSTSTLTLTDNDKQVLDSRVGPFLEDEGGAATDPAEGGSYSAAQLGTAGATDATKNTMIAPAGGFSPRGNEQDAARLAVNTGLGPKGPTTSSVLATTASSSGPVAQLEDHQSGSSSGVVLPDPLPGRRSAPTTKELRHDSLSQTSSPATPAQLGAEHANVQHAAAAPRSSELGRASEWQKRQIMIENTQQDYNTKLGRIDAASTEDSPPAGAGRQPPVADRGTTRNQENPDDSHLPGQQTATATEQQPVGDLTRHPHEDDGDPTKLDTQSATTALDTTVVPDTSKQGKIFGPVGIGPPHGEDINAAPLPADLVALGRPNEQSSSAKATATTTAAARWTPTASMPDEQEESAGTDGDQEGRPNVLGS
ncbi:unnamed protein product [Amoebophrya sp. A120]|nr:unnamed protein product [Amoebophrya sp. A120]|eukprot:GSA120T00007130001.1